MTSEQDPLETASEEELKEVSRALVRFVFRLEVETFAQNAFAAHQGLRREYPNDPKLGPELARYETALLDAFSEAVLARTRELEEEAGHQPQPANLGGLN